MASLRALALMLLAGCGAPARPSLTLAALAVAEAPVAAPASLTVDEAEALVRAHPALAAARARVRGAEAMARAEGKWKDPELRLSNLRARDVESFDDDARVRVAVRVAPPRPGELRAERARGEALAAEARAESDDEGRLLARLARRRFWDAVFAESEAGEAARLAEAQAAVVASVRTQRDAGTATNLDVSNAELDAQAASLERATAAGQAAAARAELLALLGLPEDAATRLVAPASWPELAADDTLVGRALAGRAELRAAVARVEAAAADARLERAKRWPWFNFVEVGYDFAPGIDPGLGFQLSTAISLPLGGGEGVAGADAVQAAEEASGRAAARSVADEVRARAAARAARASLIAAAETIEPALAAARAGRDEALAAGRLDATAAAQLAARAARLEGEQLRRARLFFEALEELRSAVGAEITP